MSLDVLEDHDIAVVDQALMSDFTTFRLGGTCRALLSCQTPTQVHKAVEYCHQNNYEFILIGGGSNLVVADSGISCHVIRYVSDTPMIEQNGADLKVSGSTYLDHAAQYAADHGLEGLNCTTGIPGSLGGAIVGNAGAFGKQIGDVVQCIEVIDQKGKTKTLSRDQLTFSYRNSILKETGDIVVSALLSLKPGDQEALLKERDDIANIRRAKHPDLSIDPCAGSVFRNVQPTSASGKRQAAGWFLDQAGAKSLTSGGAKIFEKHANIIVKADGCRSQDVYDLSRKMKQLANEKFDLDLIREVRFVGKFNGMPDGVTDIIW